MKFLSFLTLFVLLMQPFTYGFYKALCWQFEGRLKKRGRRLLCFALFAFGNGLIILSLLRLWHGSFRLTALWMVLLLYTGFAALFVWLLKLLLRKRVADEKLRRILRIAAPAAVASLFCLSLYNAYLPTVRHYRVVLDKPLAKPLRIGVASDLHLGILFGARQLDKLAGIMQQEKADIILLPGDIMDDDIAAYTAENMKPHLAKLRAPLGVYATLGNHDYFINPQAITRAIEDAGITVLHDQAIPINRQFWLIGRPDNLDSHRLPTADLVRKTNPAQPVILMDHRPDHIAEHARLPIDLQVSGHVHNGQIFPANFIAQTIYRPLSYGYQAIGNGHFVVTSGYGFWGIPFRLGSQSEVWIIEVRGK